MVALSGTALAEETDKNAAKPDSKPEFKVGARLHALWIMSDREDKPANEFLVDMARVTFEWRQFKLIRTKVQADLDQLFGQGDAKSLLRDAWVQVAPLKWLKIRLGQLKRPFSRLERRSRGRLETVGRGLSNELIVEDLGFGDRDLGFQLGGRIGKRSRGMEYAVGVFNGPGKNAEEFDLDGSKDIVVRVEGTPVKWLSMGLNGSFKFFDVASVDYYPEHAWMFGTDLRVKFRGFRLLAEGLFGRNHDRCLYADNPTDCRVLNKNPDIPYAWSAVLMAAYKFNLYRKWKLKLQPVLKGEVLVPDSTVDDGQVWSFSIGTNLFITRYARLMVHGEFVFPGSGGPEKFASENRMLVQLAFDL